MSDWASRRKSIYLAIVVIILTTISFSIFWKYWYRTPTCFDNLKNGDESGVDCGGSCSLICTESTIAPVVRWDPRLFEVLPGVWSAIVYVENPNTNAVATYAPYKFTLYGGDNQVLVERLGATILPRNKTVGIFEGSISIPSGDKPKRALFELGSNIVWQKRGTSTDDIEITHTPILRISSAPRVEANVKNNGTDSLDNIELVITIFDGEDNAIAASRTFIDELKGNQNSDVFFTWPKPFELGVKACEKSSDITLLIDRSGSMASEGKVPPEPLTTAKSAAKIFVDQIKIIDKVSIISFATNASNDLSLTKDFGLAKNILDSISIATSSTQYTNIYEALHFAWGELVSGRSQSGASKIIVLLTDGVATNPQNPNGKTEADDIAYAEQVAMSESANIKDDKVTVYSIGLGKNINESFLKQISTDSKHYFFAPTAKDLESIYRQISTDICEEVPARIEINYKILGKL